MNVGSRSYLRDEDVPFLVGRSIFVQKEWVKDGLFKGGAGKNLRVLIDVWALAACWMGCEVS